MVLFLKPKFKGQFAHIKIIDLIIAYILAFIIAKKMDVFIPKIIISFFIKAQYIIIYIDIAWVEISFCYLTQKDFNNIYYSAFIKINYLLMQNYIK